MPLVRKNSITQFASTGCRKQLRLSMHPDTAAYASERAALQLPHRQLRPALREIQRAGDDWGYAKILDLQQAFGDDTLFHIADVGYWNPDIITFDGFDKSGNRMKLIQHVSQLNVLLLAVRKTTPPAEPPRRIGFYLGEGTDGRPGDKP